MFSELLIGAPRIQNAGLERESLVTQGLILQLLSSLQILLKLNKEQLLNLSLKKLLLRCIADLQWRSQESNSEATIKMSALMFQNPHTLTDF